MRVIGFDPGLTRAGYAVVEDIGGRLKPVDFGTIHGADSPSQEPPAQLAALAKRLRQLIEDHQAQAMAIERVFFNRNVTTAYRTMQASGVAQCAAAEAGIAVYEYGPLEVKNALVGVGNATKSQVQYMVRRVLGLEHDVKEPDAADALALAICALHGRPWLANARIRASAQARGTRS